VSRSPCSAGRITALWISAVAALLVACSPAEEHIRNLSSADGEVRRYAAYRLLMLDERAVPFLLTVLEEGTDSTRYIAIQVLGKIGDARATQPLIAQLEVESNPDSRQELAIALGKSGDKRAVAPLERVLVEDASVAMRVEALRGLVRLRQEDLAPYLVALEDWHPRVRKESLLALVKLRYDGLPAVARNRCDDPDATIRYIAVQLLGRLSDPLGVPPLIAALSDSSMAVREEAARALGKRKVAEARDALVDLMVRSKSPDGEAARWALREITNVDWVPVE